MIAALTAAGLLLSGCAAPATVSASAQQELAFPAIYSQEPDWQRCGADEETADRIESQLQAAGGRAEGMVCARIEVPLDWDDPANDETIGLNAVRIPSTGEGERLGTLLSNPGGPGASGIEFAIGMAVSPAYAELQSQYDLLGFDPRGIATSSPLDCESDSEIFELQLAECADQDPLAESMGTAQVARDMELLRHLVGDERLNYAGFSYGTVIGASYVTLFPEHVGRVMLDSAWPSDWSSPLGTYQQREANVAAKTDMLEQCGIRYQVAACPLHDEASLLGELEELTARPLAASDGTVVDARMVDGYLTTALYQLQAGREHVLDTVGRALTGDQNAVDEIAAAMAGGGARVGMAGLVVRCLSSPRDPGVLGVYRYIQDHGLPTPLGGPEIDDTTLRPWLDLACSALPDSGEDYMMFSNASDQPVLVFGITGDHATPYAGAQQLVDELGNARLVTLDGAGHIATFGGRSTCADEIARAYLLRGELPAEGTVCTDD